MARKKKGASAAGSGWLTTYGDMVTLMLCFFVMLYEPTEVDITRLQALSASISGDPTGGSISLAAGKLADLGNTISSMPAMERGRMLGTTLKKAVSIFTPEIKTTKIAVTSDERGIVISLAADAFFARNSADLNIEDKTSLGPNMAVALVTTFYGSMMANWLLIPIASKLAYQSNLEVRSKEMIIEGILGIQSGDHPRILAQRLLTYLDPKDRKVLESELIKD